LTQRLLLVRHARTGPDHAGRLLGTTDLSLDTSGKVQAQALGARVMRHRPQVCYCSPLLRCRQTAFMIDAGLPTEFDDELREIDFGRWENRTFEEVAREDPPLVDRWASFADDFCFPGGESLHAFLQRVHAAADRLARVDAATVLVVTHGGVIRAMLCHWLGLDPRQYVVFHVGYAGLAILDLFGSRGVLSALEPLQGPEVDGG
jgi:alpha-ribazole phosphatase